MPRPLQVFLCHASQDKPEVWKLHRYLKTRGVKPWLDVEDLLPGEDWEVEIPKALFSSDIILVCLSKNSVNKEGYVQKEIAFALDKALEKPEGTIFIIPVKLEDCELPKRLSRYQAVDLFRTDGRKRLLMGLNKRIANLGEDVSPITIDDTRQRKPKTIEHKQQDKKESFQEQKEHINILDMLPKLTTNNKAISTKGEEQAKPFTRVLNPASLNPQKKSLETKDNKPNYNFRRFGIGGIILIGILGILFAGNYFLNNLSVNETPEITPTEITVTSTFSPTTAVTIAPTKSLAISTTTRLTIDSTALGEDGMLLMYVPAGEFTMGSNDGELDEQPVHQVYLDAFWIDQTEITNAMYFRCVNANQCRPKSSTSSYTRTNYFGNSEFDNYPVIYVTWSDAVAYCEFAGRRLPSEAEWEKAARGANGNIYPWGNTEPNNSLLNYANNNEDTTEVGIYPNGSSVYGVFDMSGNVWEWVSSLDKPYPYNENDGREDSNSSDYFPILRGGSWNVENYSVRSSYRTSARPENWSRYIGFRCAMDADQ